VNTFLSTAQEAVKEQYRAFAREQVAPVAKSLEARSLSLSEFWPKLAQTGFLGITIPQEFGGQDGKLLNFVLLAEAIGEQEPGLGLTLASHVAAVELIKQYGSTEQKKEYLPRLASGKNIATLAFSEDSAGTDWKAVQTTFSGQSLNGRKTSVVNGEIADLLVVLAKDSAGEVRLLLVDKAQSKDIKVMPNQSLLGLRSASINDIEFANAAASNVLAGANAEEQVMFAMDVCKVVLSAAALGLMEGALQDAAAHARTREQFGQTIGRFQAIQWKLADMSVDCSGARLQTYRAAWSKDESPKEFRKCAAMCKWLVTRQARQASSEAVQILGVKGLSCEARVERFYRDAKVMEIAEGTSESQKNILVDALGI